MNNMFKNKASLYMGKGWTFNKTIKEDNTIYIALFLNDDINRVPNKMLVGINKQNGKISSSYFGTEDLITKLQSR